MIYKETASTEIYTLSLRDALPIWADQLERVPERSCRALHRALHRLVVRVAQGGPARLRLHRRDDPLSAPLRSEEHTSELQSQFHLVCRLLLEKKKFDNFIHLELFA